MLRRYVRWLHTGWPAGTVEKLPEVREDGSTAVPGLYVVGDLAGIPLLKFSAHTGARAVQTIAADPGFEWQRAQAAEGVVDLVIVGGGVSGMSAALEAKKLGLEFRLLEASQPFATIVNFPTGKSIYTYPTEMVPAGELQFTAQVKEPLLDELRAQTLGQGIEPEILRVDQISRRGDLLELAIPKQEPIRARRVIVAIGRSGNFRKLGVPGEELGKVSNRLHDPQDYTGKHVLVVGGGDSAVEAAIALTQGGARVSLSYRKPELTRPKPENVAQLHALAADPDAEVAVEQPSSSRQGTATGRYLTEHVGKPGSLTLYLGSTLEEITDDSVRLTAAGGEETTLPNQAVFSMIGREAPLDFFRRSGVPVRGELSGKALATLALVLGFCVWLYHWKSSGGLFYPSGDTFPLNAPELISGWGEAWAARVQDRTTLFGTLAISLKSPSFYYTFTYLMLIVVFGIRRIRRRRTPYVTLQTSVLIAVQALPLFLLPELILPWLGYNGYFEAGWLSWIGDQFFPLYTSSDAVWPSWGHPRAYWRAYGLILAWPLMIYNVFTSQPIAAWLVLSGVQTFVLIPLMVWRWGKGAYCGWICSCGGLAETLGDTHRQKMPHGPKWNRLNMLGQAILFVCFALLAVRITGWVMGPESWAAQWFPVLAEGKLANGKAAGLKYLSYKWIVDVGLAGIVGVGLYFHFSGRMWCRFACPLAALMHIYARFSQFRILPEKKKCISCDVCTSVCHQGIDIMSFANKGLPMADPQCVRCSACVQSCPTGVLQFGRIDRKTGAVLAYDRLAASPVQMAERGRKLPVVSGP